MQLTPISDTHGFRRPLTLDAGDGLVHAGDLTAQGTRRDAAEFLERFGMQPFRHKIFIAGNHDFFFEEEAPDRIRDLLPPGVTYLCDSGIEIAGVRFWGSPITPWFHGWAFGRSRGPA